MSTTQLRSDAVAQHQFQVASLLQDNGLIDEYNEKDGMFDQDSYRMALFKVLPCQKQTQHDWSCCPYAHPNERSRRRCLMVQPYLARVCPDMQTKGECPRGEGCAMTHSMFEYWMHPQRYRTKMCREGAECPRHYCFFAHSPDQLRKAS
ncbi:hypothetical protein OEZ86_001848 [Tetradesmus obliquus]|nr:hypothetical protein OEZ86_001848 [Tetradesmus obliquus]